MKLIHKVEDSAVYESNKHSYDRISPSPSMTPIKTFLLKISSSNTPETALTLLSTLSNLVKCTHTSTSIKLKALKITPLKNFIEEDMHSSSCLNNCGMAYTFTLKLLADIATQLEHIREKYGFIIPFLSLEDIVVVTQMRNQQQYEEKKEKEEEIRENDTTTFEYTFIFINAEKLMQEPKLTKKDLIIDIPLKVNKHTSFLPAELPESALKRLPMRVTTTSWQYSLSTLCIYALLQHKFKNGEDDIERIGRPFLHTSLYFCLKRCLKLDPEERTLVYV